MARCRARGWVATVGLAVLAGGCTAPVSGQSGPPVVRATAAAPTPPVHAAPLRPLPTVAAALPDPPETEGTRLWPFRRLFGHDYVDARAIAERYGLRPAWLVGGRVLQLTDDRGRGRLKLEDRDRDCWIDGVRVFLGDPVAFFQGSLYVSKVDVIKTVVPLLRPADDAFRLPRPPRLIVLDPGHGGNDDGTSNRRLKLLEKELTLDTARRVERLLAARGYRVVLTRTDDRYVALDRRDEIAVREHADLFLSIHFNSSEPSVAGTETYVITPQFQTSTQPEQDKSMIPVAYPGNHHDLANIVFGYALHRAVIEGLGLPDRGLKRRRLAVLRLIDCPAALVESAYLSNEAEARRVATPEYRERVAGAIARGVEDYAALLASLHPGGRAEETRRGPEPSR